jgi:pyrroline-5-carboxylate reductase
MNASHHPHIAFIGGGNMASAILGGCISHGLPPSHVWVVDPNADQRTSLSQRWAVHVLDAACDSLQEADIVIWAVKPQALKDVVCSTRPYTRGDALHLSVAAGVTSDSLSQWLASENIVRAMPNTPALVGAGATALFARDGVSETGKTMVTALLESTGLVLWVPKEVDLEAVTAVSGSGPAYVFYWLEAMVQGGVALGLSESTAQQLAIATFRGAAKLAASSEETPGVLRDRVTSKGGTTFEALEVMRSEGVAPAVIKAMHACARRARELGQEYGD